MARALIHVPKTAKKGEAVEIKTLIAHPMESGFRAGMNGKMIPRDIIIDFTCAFEGQEIFRAEFSPAIAANPFMTFFFVPTKSGTLTFRWRGDNGFDQTETAALDVA